MKVLVIGATGYIGGVVVERLLEHGHEVAALVRKAGVEVAGVRDVRVGDLGSAARAVTADVDAVVHAASLIGDEAADLAAIGALVGAGKPVHYVSGIWVLGRTDEGFEGSVTNPLPIVGYRPKVEEVVLAAGGTVIRPGIVHGRGGGIAALFVGQAAERGVGVYVQGAYEEPTWTFVHVDDLADLIVAAVERGAAGAVYHGVAEEGVAVKEFAGAAAGAAGVSGVEAWPVGEAASLLGAPFAEALALSQRASSAVTREKLGWEPHRAGVLAELGEGSYRR